MADRSHRDRWWQLIFGCIAMMAISSPQYVWTLFVGPIGKALGGSLAALQVTFLLLIVLQTFFSPFQAYFVERFGPRLLISIGAALSGSSWILAAHASSLLGLYLTYGVLGGLGTGIIYVAVIGLMVRWFPDRRGLAAGIAAADAGAAREFLAAYGGTGAFWNATTRLLDGFKLFEVPETGINLDAVPGPRGPVTFRDLSLRQFVVTPKI